MGQGEDDVEVLDREQVGPPGLEPVDLNERMALGAVPIATRVVDRTSMSAAITGFEVTTQGGRSTLAQVSDDPALDGTDRMGLFMMLSMSAQEIAELRRSPCSG